jgi:hypothetical protein
LSGFAFSGLAHDDQVWIVRKHNTRGNKNAKVCVAVPVEIITCGTRLVSSKSNGREQQIIKMGLAARR